MNEWDNEKTQPLYIDDQSIENDRDAVFFIVFAFVTCMVLLISAVLLGTMI